jgi:epoxyqueuosine reductase QueG
MKSISEKIRFLAESAGPDMVGFAPVERFAAGPERTRPTYYLPAARSVISVGIGYPRSIGEVWGTYAEEGALPGPDRVPVPPPEIETNSYCLFQSNFVS